MLLMNRNMLTEHKGNEKRTDERRNVKCRDEVFRVESVKAYLSQDFILFLVSECGYAFIANNFEFLK